MELQLAKRPSPSTLVMGKKVKLLTNYYRFNFTNPKKNQIFKYTVKFTPEIPDNSRKIRNKVVNAIRSQLQEYLGFFIFMGNCLYSLENSPEIPKHKSEYDGISYELEINWVQYIGEMDSDRLIFYKIFFNSLLKKIKYKQIGRNFFNPNQSVSLNQYNLEVWPGFASSLHMLQNGVMLNVDICHKVIRTETVLKLIEDIKKNCRGDLREEIKKTLIGTTVMTIYNKRTYKVDDIEFNKSLYDTFQQEDGTEITYQDYFRKKYSKNISDPNQPVIVNVNQKTGNQIILIPELCQMTGLSDSLRANFNIMKEMSSITNSDATKRVEECKNLLEMFKRNERCRQEMENWQVEISHSPVEISGQKINAGNLVMGKNDSGVRIEFDLETTHDIDRKIQSTMYSQPEIKKWGIFYSDFDRKTAIQFLETLEKCSQQFKYKILKPREFQMKGTRFQDWEQAIRENLDGSVQAIVLILPGQKGKAPLYDDLKKLLLKEVPVPSQVVLSNTISRGKNVRSICNKILIQICAKIGGEPWAVNDMPFFDKPTMICGMDVYHKTGTGSKSILAFTASINQRATKYWSCAKVQDEGQEISNTLESVMHEALSEFQKKNGVAPQNLIIYRDGVGDSQRSIVINFELPQIQQAIKRHNLEETTKVMIILVNKRINQRLFNTDHPQKICNPQPGTIVDSGIVQKDSYDFFLVSQVARVGVVSPTHYVVVYDSIKEDAQQIQLLTYKLCYTYYNVSGSIKVPAPVQYAHRLSNLIGDRVKGHFGVPIPHEHFGKNIQGLYFI
ncbi:macronuclear development protein 1 [Stylonychia lemnae]|uniref:Macronuclear development protein 1 n=1 Tax=Stylonychia lemnae TaxID=5949 RepID=A0A078AF31_STYLE|nr:macronuclear development protein 1 [Stylonychia lemnae]|eukprot:CDW80416.1 macronuclear development protein 1 [Stylonychia lemnae]